ncbi:hypothetical protein F5Y09DRAFT_357001 [Xylaria sp. FL1042]|nr:hypothetical protein F5Y09DRAFT_357001 [Xylaria sp. FL1042]
MADSDTDSFAADTESFPADDRTTLRGSGNYDGLIEALEDIAIDPKLTKDEGTQFAIQESFERPSEDHWLRPDPSFILEQVKKMRIYLACRVCNQKGEPADFVLCGGCGAARMPAHRQCISSATFHQPGADEENMYGSPCEEVDFQEFVYTSWLMDSKLQSKDQVALHLEDIWSTWLGLPDGQDGPDPQIHIFPRLESLMAEATNRPPRQYPSLVSIIGDTGSGKSTLIAAMIRLLAPTAHRQNRVPVPGRESDSFDSTSSDVHVFADPKTIHTEYPCFFVDCEGFSGTDKPVSRQLLEQAQQPLASQASTDVISKKTNITKAIAEHALTVSNRVDLKWGRLFSVVGENTGPLVHTKGHTTVDPKTRSIVVKSLYPRLLYSFSDVVCFVTNNSRSSHNILQDMFKWAKEGHEKTLNQRVRPGLIIVLNKMSDGSHDSLADVGQATKRLLDNFQRSNRFADLQRRWMSRGKQIHTAEELILCYYDSFRVVSVPQYTSSSPSTVKKTSDQIKSLYNEICKMSELMMKKRQSLDKQLDTARLSAYLAQTLVSLGQDYQGTIDFHRLSKQDSSLPRRFSEHLLYVMSNIAVDRHFNTSEALGGEVNLVSQMTSYIAACIVAQIDSTAAQDEIQKRKNDLVDEARRGVDAFRAHYWRCEFKDSRGQRRCKNYWSSHEKGHQFEEQQGESQDVIVVGSFKCSYDPEAFAESLWKQVTRLRTRQSAIDTLASAAVACSAASITGQKTCLSCLSNAPTNMLPCRPKQHCICESCIRRYNKEQTGDSIIHITSCPLGCSLTTSPRAIRVKPLTAGARILSLDGGGIRGIAELAILSELEREVGPGFRIQDLFDLVIGTSTGKYYHLELFTQKTDAWGLLGGIIALGVFEKNWSLVDAESMFKELVKTAFSKKLLMRPPLLSRVSKLFMSVKYKTEGIESSLKNAFGDGYLFGQADGHKAGGDAVKVAVVTCVEGRNQPTLIV